MSHPSIHTHSVAFEEFLAGLHRHPVDAARRREGRTRKSDSGAAFIYFINPPEHRGLTPP